MRYAIVLLGTLSFVALPTQAEDVSGEKIFTEQCSECHRASNYSGGNPNKLAETIGKIVAGHTEHEVRLTLTHEEVAAVARYVTGN